MAKRRYEDIELATCPVCGKAFYIPDEEEWYWVHRGHMVCSYGCMRKVERGEVTLKTRGWMPKVIKPLFYEIRDLRKQGKTYNEIRRMLHISEGTVGVAIRVLRDMGIEVD